MGFLWGWWLDPLCSLLSCFLCQGHSHSVMMESMKRPRWSVYKNGKLKIWTPWEALVDEKWTMFSLWSFSCCLQWACWVKWYPWLAFPDNLSNSLKPLVTGNPAKQAGYWLFYSFMLGNTSFPLTKLEIPNKQSALTSDLQTSHVLNGYLWELCPLRPVLQI